MNGGRYLFRLSSCDATLLDESDGSMFLYIPLEMSSCMRSIDVFESIARETSAMAGLLSMARDLVSARDTDGLMIPDGVGYDGKGVELRLLFGYMTGGSLNRLSGMNAKWSHIKVMAWENGDVALTARLHYSIGNTEDSRDVRIASGFGMDEAFRNAYCRLDGLLADIRAIEESLFGDFCIDGVDVSRIAGDGNDPIKWRRR